MTRHLYTSEIAKRVGVHLNIVRLYEEWGFLPLIPRSPSGYRLFTEAHLEQMRLARYRVGVYPALLRLVLTWIVPVGVMTTVPARALTGELSPWLLAGSLVLAALLSAGVSLLFHAGLRCYAGASS